MIEMINRYKFMLGAAFAVGAMITTPVFADDANETQESILVFDKAIFFDGYNSLEGISDASKAMIPEDDGILRHRTSLYAVKLTEEQLSKIGEKLTMQVEIGALCDNYDRIGNINLAFVPKGNESYNIDDVQRVELGRFITPFMNKNKQPDVVPYEFNVDNVSLILRDKKIREEFDIWVEFELFGIPYAANTQVSGCKDRQDVFTGTLRFLTDSPADLTDNHVFVPVVIKNPEYIGKNFNNYSEGATDVEGKADKTWSFELPENVEDGQVVLIISNHGANSGGEEYNRRTHWVYFDEERMMTFKPGRESCEPFRQYNTQANGIYGLTKRSDDEWQSFSNWCPGDVIDIRTFNVGALEKGTHGFRLRVPLAKFADKQGDFPVSIYFQGVKKGQLPGSASIENVKVDMRSSFGIDGNKCYVTSEQPIRELLLYQADGTLIEMEFKAKELSLAKCQPGVHILVVEYSDGLTEYHKFVR